MSDLAVNVGTFDLPLVDKEHLYDVDRSSSIRIGLYK